MFSADKEAIRLFEEIRDYCKTDWDHCIKLIRVALRVAYSEGGIDEVERFKRQIFNNPLKNN